MPYSLVIDVLVAVLLVVTIGYAVSLNRKLGSLRRDKAELEKMAASFGNATIRAEESIRRLKTMADHLQDRIEKAQGLRDDLAFLIDRGSAAADRLEGAIRDSRHEIDPVAAAAVEPAAARPRPQAAAQPQPAAAPPKSEAERALLRALGAAR